MTNAHDVRYRPRMPQLFLVCCFACALAIAQENTGRPSSVTNPPAAQIDLSTTPSRDHPRWSSSGFLYKPDEVPPVNLKDSGTLKSLLQNGRIVLSMQDAIVVALENNLDIQLQRYTVQMADSEVMRAKGGGILRGIPFTIAQPPAGIGGPSGSALLNSATVTLPTASSVFTSVTNLALLTEPQADLSITGATPLSTGPPVPAFDPAITGTVEALRVSTGGPLPAGAEAVVYNASANLALSKGFATGTQISVGVNNTTQAGTAIISIPNPFTSANALSFNLVQPLLRGFGVDMNRRFIRIANNNRQVSDLLFRDQVMETVYGVMRLYIDLASLSEDVNVKKVALAAAQQLYENNRVQVEVGTLAPLELLRAQALVAASELDLANSQGLFEEQQVILKTVLSRRGMQDLEIRRAELLPSGTLSPPPDVEQRPLEQLFDEAIRNRPELPISSLQLTNSQIALEGSRNAVRPQLDIIATAQNRPLNTSALTGLANLGVISPSSRVYALGLNLDFPLRNRTAQADVVRDQLQVRQSQIRSQQVQEQVREEVEDAVIALRRARAAYAAASRSRQYQEQLLQEEKERLTVGASTNYIVIQDEASLAQARSTEVVTLGALLKAELALQRATGTILDVHGIDIAEAYKGVVKTPLPQTPPAPPQPHP